MAYYARLLAKQNLIYIDVMLHTTIKQRMKNVRPIFLSMVLIALAASGCGSPVSVVSGTVTYDGQPVAQGGITFYPKDGKGPAVGAEVTDGQYRVEGIMPGSKTVQVSGSVAKDVLPVPQTTEEMRMQSEQAGTDKGGTLPGARRALIPLEANGNGVVVEIHEGNTTHDFHLKASGE